MIVFFDTNVYEAAKFNFHKPNFEKVTKYLSEGKMILLYTSITAGEVKNHIRVRVKDEVEKYNGLIRKNTPILRNIAPLGVNELSCDEVIDYVIQDFDQFLHMPNVIRVPLNPMDAEELIEDHFSRRLPFEDKKPNEFKDAIMIKAIKTYQKQVGESILIVSHDEGFKASFIEPGFKVVDFIGSAIMEVEKADQKEITEVEEAVKNLINEGKLDEGIIYVYSGARLNRESNVKNYCSYYEITGVLMDLVSVEKDSEGRDNTYLVTIHTTFFLDVEVNYLNPEKSFYKSEGKGCPSEEYDSCNEKHEIMTDIPLLIEFSEEDSGLSLMSYEVQNQQNIKELDIGDETISSDFFD